MIKRSHTPLHALVVLAVLAGKAEAQAPAPESVAYEADFFAPFNPQTALDMVERVPGFTIDEGEERRGFAGAQSNVLIDGEPPTSKAQEIDDTLARIPASDVVRIELVRSSASGNAQWMYVNVVRRVGDGEGVWDLGAAFAEDGRVSPSGELSYSGRRGAVQYGLAAALDVAHAPIEGERFDYDATGALDQRHAELIPTDEREARLSGEVSFPIGDWRAGLTAQLSRTKYDERVASSVFDAGGLLDETIAEDIAERESAGELGASMRREAGPWSTELAAIITRSRFEAEESAEERDAVGVLDESVRQLQRLETGETIVRGVVQHERSDGWSVELSAEAALNTLEQRLELTEDDGSGPVPVPLPSANVLVEEERAEFGAMVRGPLAPDWSLEMGVAFEASLLSQRGDVDAETELQYWKPTLQLVRVLGERNLLRFRIYRDVGQLDFEDFVSAADIQNAVVNAGNPDLVPQTSWRFEAAGDWRFGDDGALGVTLYHWAIEDALDIVPVGTPGNLFDAPGNIGDASLWGARVQASMPLPWDAELRLDAMAQRTEANDPLTGETRAISESDESALIVGFRQDVGRYAWGFDYEQEIEAPSFRLDRIETEREAEELSLWVETTAFDRVKLRVWIENLSDSAEVRRRQLYDPDRLGAFDGSDSRARRQGVTLGISASGRF